MFKPLSEPLPQEQDILSLSLNEIARQGVKKLLLHALDLEVNEYISRHYDKLDEDGKRLVVRNGKGKSRKITTGAGALEVQAP